MRPPLHPAVQAYLNRVAAANAPPYSALTPADCRAQVISCPEPREEVASVHNLTIPGPGGELPLRLYEPLQPVAVDPSPICVFLHGGGWMLCDIECYDGMCRTFANASGCRIASLEYRLSPEFKFPAALEDTYAALTWAASLKSASGRAPRLAIAGDSAGGNLAAAACLLSREQGGPQVDFQLLIYPITDFSFDTKSYHENANGYRLSRDSMEFFWRHYLGNPANGSNPYASPLRAKSLANLPPAAILTCEYDPLRDEGRAYAARLREAGVPVEEIHLTDNIHGYLRHTDQFPQAREMIEHLGGLLKTGLTRS